MPQESTLLAYLVPRLTSSVEDTATDALAFILNKSPACRDALGLLLREGEGSYQLDAPASFDTQVTYKDGSRPDMVGYDQGGGKRLLVESKFWTTLLEGQASSYFDQLEDAGPGVLLFIAPRHEAGDTVGRDHTPDGERAGWVQAGGGRNIQPDAQS